MNRWESRQNGALIVKEAHEALSEHGEMPSAHAISFVADGLGETDDKPLRDGWDDIPLKHGFKPSQVTHMLVTFSGNDPSSLLNAHLASYGGAVRQHDVGLQVTDHQDFIQSVFTVVGV